MRTRNRRDSDRERGGESVHALRRVTSERSRTCSAAVCMRGGGWKEWRSDDRWSDQPGRHSTAQHSAAQHSTAQHGRIHRWSRALSLSCAPHAGCLYRSICLEIGRVERTPAANTTANDHSWLSRLLAVGCVRARCSSTGTSTSAVSSLALTSSAAPLPSTYEGRAHHASVTRSRQSPEPLSAPSLLLPLTRSSARRPASSAGRTHTLSLSVLASSSCTSERQLRASPIDDRGC